MAIKSGCQKWILESRAMSAINAIKMQAPFSVDAPIAELIRSLSLFAPQASLLQCLRKANYAAHDLARFCLINGCNEVYLDAIPWMLKKFVTNDILHLRSSNICSKKKKI